MWQFSAAHSRHSWQKNLRKNPKNPTLVVQMKCRNSRGRVNPMKTISQIIIVAAVVMLAAGQLQAQGATATISGTVLDPSAAAIAGASITVRNVETAFTRTVTSDDQGRYVVPELPIGDYEVQGSLPGFQTVVRRAILLDGENIQDWWQRGTGAAVTGTSLGIEGIAEFQTLTNTYSAEFGGNGAVINSATRSGTNSFHGSVYEFLRNNALDARNFFEQKSAAPFRRNQFGASVGGPVKRSKAFFFFNYEGLRQHLDQSFQAFVPTLAVRAQAAPSVKSIVDLYPAPTTDLGVGI